MSIMYGDYPLKQLTKTKLYYPVTLEEAKRHLRVDDTFVLDDDYITALIQAATKKAEEYIGKDIALTNNVLLLDNYSGDTLFYEEGFFNSLTSVVTDSSSLVVPSKTRKYLNAFYLEFTNYMDADPLTVTFKTGFTQGECPLDIKQAILIKIGDLYDGERSSYTFTSSRDTKAFERMLDSYKILIF